MTDFKAIAESLIQDSKEGMKIDQKDFQTFKSELLQVDDFKKTLLSIMIESAQKAAGIMLNSDSKEDALKMIEIGSVSDPLMQLCYIGFEFGKRASKAEEMEKMFSTAVLDSQEPL